MVNKMSNIDELKDKIVFSKKNAGMFLNAINNIDDWHSKAKKDFEDKFYNFIQNHIPKNRRERKIYPRLKKLNSRALIKFLYIKWSFKIDGDLKLSYHSYIERITRFNKFKNKFKKLYDIKDSIDSYLLDEKTMNELAKWQIQHNPKVDIEKLFYISNCFFGEFICLILNLK
jgi:hypothetical protein